MLLVTNWYLLYYYVVQYNLLTNKAESLGGDLVMSSVAFYISCAIYFKMTKYYLPTLERYRR